MMAERVQTDLAPLKGVLKKNEPMRRHTSWRAGGEAQYFYTPANLDDLRRFLRALPLGEPVCMLGLGSNLLVRDGGIPGTTILLHSALNELSFVEDTQLIFAQAGVASPKVARFAAKRGLDRAEFLAGIPGTIGGALAMNAGCYGMETWQIVKKVMTINHRGDIHEREPVAYEIGYREVQLRDAKQDEWFVGAWLALPKGDAFDAQNKIKDLLNRRIASQPLNQPNAGSVFRNPPGDHAARLIEAAGLKGTSVGGAMVSEKHANFIVNTGSASALDIESLINVVQTRVLEKFTVPLIREVRIVGLAKEARSWI